MADKPVLNLADVPLKDNTHGERFEARIGRMGPLLGLTQLGCTLHIVPPGKRAYPFHTHHVIEEMFVILSGEGEYRFGEQTYPLKSGDVLAAPAGKSPHQIINTGRGELRYLGISTIGSVDVCEYPDSGKVASAAGIKNADFRTATFVQISRMGEKLDYWEGEK
jgi:uncharacterized cupin superfamily protein